VIVFLTRPKSELRQTLNFVHLNQSIFVLESLRSQVISLPLKVDIKIPFYRFPIVAGFRLVLLNTVSTISTSQNCKSSLGIFHLLKANIVEMLSEAIQNITLHLS